ncbi:MAG: 50S ribosomal protein L3 N(5)-glutamine methyltransferase [Pseudomonadota bacterium]|nr:50S ribosomal protein L3 N(5)-glutamine methyltransferase [Pseudomonadota bacterium]
MATARDLIERAAVMFVGAGLHFGHGTDNAHDEATFIVLHVLGLDYPVDEGDLTRTLQAEDVHAALSLVNERIRSRRPAAYLTHAMWFAGRPFYVDERVLVPRSPIAEMVRQKFQPWLGRQAVRRILDIGTGCGCIALTSALEFSEATVHATDLSTEALQVAAINRERFGLQERVQLECADLYPESERNFDLIVSNPPYVPDTRLECLPVEFLREPRIALAAGDDGLKCVKRILAQAAEYLADGGLLVMEVGEIWPELERYYPDIPFTWVDFQRGGEGVFVLRKDELASLT